jgi:prophage regulatory protein
MVTQRDAAVNTGGSLQRSVPRCVGEARHVQRDPYCARPVHASFQIFLRVDSRAHLGKARTGFQLETSASTCGISTYSSRTFRLRERSIQTAGNQARAVIPDSSPAPFMRLPMVMRWTGLGRSTIYRLIAAQQFPPPVLLATRAVAWRLTDLERWSADRPTSWH